MGCMASKEFAVTDVEAVTPGACTVFGAKYLVPHGKRVYLAFSKDTLSSFDILDVTNGSGPEAMVLFHVQANRGAESQSESDAHVAFTVRDPCMSNGTSNAPPLLWVAKETRCVYAPDPNRGGTERLLFSLSKNNGMTQDLTSPRNPNQHIYVQNKVDWEQQSSGAPTATGATGAASSRGAIILLNADPLNKNKTQKTPIARVCSAATDDGDDLQRLGLGPPSDFLQGHVILQVAPGADMALMTAMVLLSIASSSARCEQL